MFFFRQVIFPPYDKQAWNKGDKRTQATTTSVDIAVSQDLHILAPNVQNFLENWEIPMAEVPGWKELEGAAGVT